MQLKVKNILKGKLYIMKLYSLKRMTTDSSTTFSIYVIKSSKSIHKDTKTYKTR